MSKQLLDNAPPPTEDAVAGPGGLLTAAWRQWFLRIPDTLSAIPSRLNTVELSNQTASITATDFSGGALRAGLYRATYGAQATAGAVTVTFRWTDGGASRSWSSSESTGTVLMRVAASGSMTYSASYVGSGSYSLDVVLERMRA